MAQHPLRDRSWRGAQRAGAAIDPRWGDAGDPADDGDVSPGSPAVSTAPTRCPKRTPGRERRADPLYGARAAAHRDAMRPAPLPPAPLAVLKDAGDIVVVDKPAGYLVHNSAWAGPPEHTLTEAVRTAFPEAVPLHRLDRQTSGCAWFSTSRAAAAAATARFLAHPKVYLALVRGHVKDAVDVDYALDDDDDPGSARKPAHSRVAPIACSDVDRCSLVEVTLFTGRKHQARRHLKHISHPILGDATHGHGPLNRAYRERYGLTRMALHCAVTQLDDEVIAAPWPADLVVVSGHLFAGVDVKPRSAARAPP